MKSKITCTNSIYPIGGKKFKQAKLWAVDYSKKIFPSQLRELVTFAQKFTDSNTQASLELIINNLINRTFIDEGIGSTFEFENIQLRWNKAIACERIFYVDLLITEFKITTGYQITFQDLHLESDVLHKIDWNLFIEFLIAKENERRNISCPVINSNELKQYVRERNMKNI